MMKNLGKKIYRVIFSIVSQILTLVVIYIKIKIKKHDENIWLLNTPVHGNIGDQSIAIAEIDFLKRNFPNVTAIEVNSLEWVHQKERIKKAVYKKDLIIIHGGGYIGTLWRNESNTMFEIINTFPDNKIIIFPQSAYYDNELSIYEDKIKFSIHKHLWVCARDKKTEEILIDNLGFAKDRVILVPDIVTTYRRNTKNKKRNKALLVFRNDKEKSTNEVKKILIQILNRQKMSYQNTDMVSKYCIHWFRRIYVENKLRQFENSSFVITDRLHGMYFSVITNTPCIAFDNVSGKIGSGYEWLKGLRVKYNCEYEKYDLLEQVDQIRHLRKYNVDEYEKKFEHVKTIIKEWKLEINL